MSDICKNCNSEIMVNFCGNCGQKKATRIDKKYLQDELQYTILHTNKGFFYSIKKIFKSPGKTAREFLEGNRVNHYKPIMLVSVLASINVFLTNTLIHPIEIYTRFNEIHGIQAVYDSSAFSTIVLKFQSFIMMLFIPLLAFFSWVVFRKWGYNYFENFILNAYMISSTLILNILFLFPVQFFMKGNPDLYVVATGILSYLLLLIVYLWFFIDLYNEKTAWQVIKKLLLMLVFFLGFVIILSAIGGLIAGILMHL